MEGRRAWVAQSLAREPRRCLSCAIDANREKHQMGTRDTLRSLRFPPADTGRLLVPDHVFCTMPYTATHAALVSASSRRARLSVAIGASPTIAQCSGTTPYPTSRLVRMGAPSSFVSMPTAVATCVPGRVVAGARARSRRWRGSRGRPKFDYRLDRGDDLRRVRLHGLLLEERIADLRALDPAEAEQRSALRRDAEDVLEQDDAGGLVRHARVDLRARPSRRHRARAAGCERGS